MTKVLIAGVTALAAPEPVDALRVRLALDLAGSHKVVQMGKALADGEEQLVFVERTGKHHRQQRSRGHRGATCVQGFRQAVGMVAGQLVEPLVEPLKRRPRTAALGCRREASGTARLTRETTATDRHPAHWARQLTLGHDGRQDLVAGDAESFAPRTTDRPIPGACP